MNVKELCDFIGITTPTYYNWRKEKPNLFKIINDFKDKKQNNFIQIDDNLQENFKELDEFEKNYIKAEIKMLISRKQI